MDQHIDSLALLVPEGMAPAAGMAKSQARQVPWVDGHVLRYVRGDVLDIQLAGERMVAPVVAGATVSTILPGARGTPADTLPQTDFDCIFARDSLAAACRTQAQFNAVLERLRPGGHLVMILCQTDAEPQELLRMVADLLPGAGCELILNTVQARRYGPGAPEADDAELCVVLRKLPPPVKLASTAVSDPVLPFIRPAAAVPVGEGKLLVRDFGPSPMPVQRILVLKLDHHGDFIIGLPALRALRGAFPRAHIKLICGPWNAASAHACGLFDDVACFCFFTEKAMDWTGRPEKPDWALFDRLVAGRYDLAIDLRVDEDTRPLLGRIDAAQRCGIGSASRMPMVDIALPDAPRDQARPGSIPHASQTTGADTPSQLTPADFDSRMETRTASYHEARFPGGDSCLLHSRAIFLPRGRYHVLFDLGMRGFVPRLGGVRVELRVAHGSCIAAARILGRLSLLRLRRRQVGLEFDSMGDGDLFTFQLHVGGAPWAGRLRFFGATLSHRGTPMGRLQPSDLHVGEKLTLLVNLIVQRVGTKSAPGLPPPSPAPHIVVAPFSNSTVRDWPAAHYAALIDDLVQQHGASISLVGAGGQAAQAAHLQSLLAAPTQRAVTNLVGATSWADLGDVLRGADLVICNNSGIGHQAAALGARTLAIYSASHQPQEWGPRGPHARALMMQMACSPCGYERIADCKRDHACMRMITPEMVLAQAREMLGAAEKAQ